MEFQENSSRGKRVVCYLKFIFPFSFNRTGFGDVLSFEFSSPSLAKYGYTYVFYVTKIRQYWVSYFKNIPLPP